MLGTLVANLVASLAAPRVTGVIGLLDVEHFLTEREFEVAVREALTPDEAAEVLGPVDCDRWEVEAGRCEALFDLVASRYFPIQPLGSYHEAIWGLAIEPYPAFDPQEHEWEAPSHLYEVGRATLLALAAPGEDDRAAAAGWLAEAWGVPPNLWLPLVREPPSEEELRAAFPPGGGEEGIVDFVGWWRAATGNAFLDLSLHDPYEGRVPLLADELRAWRTHWAEASATLDRIFAVERQVEEAANAGRLVAWVVSAVRRVIEPRRFRPLPCPAGQVRLPGVGDVADWGQFHAISPAVAGRAGAIPDVPEAGD